MTQTTAAKPFRTYAVMHNDGTKGRVMGIEGDYTRVSFRENGKDESIEIRSSLLTSQWHRDYTVR
jgi:hypothetical protein